MFVRLSKFVKLAEEAAWGRGVLMTSDRERARLSIDLKAAQKEIQRLTNVVIRMKQEGYSTYAGDQTWGSYVMDDLEREQAAREPTKQHEPALDFDDEAVAAAEESMRAELDQILADD